MKWKKVEFVRVYLTEADKKLEPLLKRLHDVEKVKGVTVTRGITGFGGSGKIHTTSLLDLSLDLPVIVEFYDVAEKLESVLEHLADLVEPGHIIKASVEMNS